MASSSNVDQELAKTRRLLALAERLLETQGREIAALRISNEAKDAELERLRMEKWSAELLESMRQPPTTLEQIWAALHRGNK